MAIALVYVLLAACIGTVIAGGSLAGTITAAFAGCTLEIGGAEVRLPIDGSGANCWQRVDVVTQSVTLLGTVLLWALAVWLLGRRSRATERIVPLGAVTVAASGFIPFATVAWLVDFYQLTPGPLEVGVAVVPLVWGVVSAGIVFRAWRVEVAPSRPEADR